MKVIAGIILLFVFASAGAELLGRLPATAGGTDYQAYYDTQADLTWLADTNASRTNMSWSDANIWAENLNISGAGSWRLPVTAQPDPNCTRQDFLGSRGSNCILSEMGNLRDNVLGGQIGLSLTPTHNANYDLFINVKPVGYYWTATTVSLDPDFAWAYSIDSGDQSFGQKTNTTSLWAWAVHDGDVSGVVPVPAAVWLFGSGLIGLAGIARRKHAS